MLAGQFLTAAHDPRYAPIGDRQVPDLSRFAAKPEPRLILSERNVAVLKSCQSEAAIGARILAVANSYQRKFEQSDDGDSNLRRSRRLRCMSRRTRLRR